MICRIYTGEEMKKKVAVLFGGVSVEHEVSVISGVQAFHALDRDRYDPIAVYVSKEGRWYVGDILADVANFRDMPALLRGCMEVAPHPIRGDWSLYPTQSSGWFQAKRSPIAIDVYLPVFHGSFGEDGSVQGLLQIMDVPFTGCDVTGSAVSMDKVVMKEVLRGLGIPVVSSCSFTRFELEEAPDVVLERIESACGMPCILKPALLGSSIGIEVVREKSELLKVAHRVASYCPKVLVEIFLPDMFELNCSVLGNESQQRASVIERPLSSGELLSFSDKYERSRSGKSGVKAADSSSSMASMDRIIPADISPEMTREVQDLAVRTFRGLGCSGVSRVDCIVDRCSQTTYVNELNAIPGSLSFYLWEASGVPFQQLLNELIDLALVRFRERQSTNYTYSSNLFSLHGGSVSAGAKGSGSKMGGGKLLGNTAETRV
jgi:D-alanine-D-alanine ligase